MHGHDNGNGNKIKGLRGAIRDLRRQSNDQLAEEAEARRIAVNELEAALEQAQRKEAAVAEANAELLKLRSELTKTQGEVQVCPYVVVCQRIARLLLGYIFLKVGTHT